jgi:DNA polymerase III subunit delta
MPALREDQFAAFLSRQMTLAVGLLIYGDDSAAAEDLGRQAATKATGGDVQAIMRLEASLLSSDPSRISDEVMALSLLGGRSAILVSGCDDNTLKYTGSIISSPSPANFLVLVAGSLTKSSKLRAACEQAERFYCLPLYEAKADTILASISKILEQQGLKLDADAARHFVDIVGTDRMTAQREAEKLGTYAHGQSTISVADIDAVCGDTASFDADALVDAVFGGDLEATERISLAMEGEGSSARPVLPLLMSHVSRLQSLHLEMAKGMTADSAIAAAKPIVFFNRRRAMADHLRKLDLAKLDHVQSQLASAIIASRKTAALAQAITNRCLLSVARLVRSSR